MALVESQVRRRNEIRSLIQTPAGLAGTLDPAADRGGASDGRTTQRISTSASLTAFAEAIQATRYDLLSTNLFDTDLLRNHTIQSDRLAIACRRSAARLSVGPSALKRHSPGSAEPLRSRSG